MKKTLTLLYCGEEGFPFYRMDTGMRVGLDTVIILIKKGHHIVLRYPRKEEKALIK